MNIPNPYFKNIPTIGDLTLEYIFLENGYPVLFTCIGNNHLYLCVCCDVYHEQRWLIVPMSTSELTGIISGLLSVRSVFSSSEKSGCVAIWTKEKRFEEYSIMPCGDFLEEDLPDDDLYLNELDDPDFIEYEKIVRNRDNASFEIDGMKYFRSENTSSSVLKIRGVNLKYRTDVDNAWKTQRNRFLSSSIVLSNIKISSCDNVMNQPELPFAS